MGSYKIAIAPSLAFGFPGKLSTTHGTIRIRNSGYLEILQVGFLIPH